MSIQEANHTELELVIENVCMARKPPDTRWDVCCRNGVIASLQEHKSVPSDQETGTRFLCPSLCHPHIHVDKCFLLGHPKYADLEIEQGDFAEAMKLTSRFISFQRFLYSSLGP